MILFNQWLTAIACIIANTVDWENLPSKLFVASHSDRIKHAKVILTTTYLYLWLAYLLMLCHFIHYHAPSNNIVLPCMYTPIIAV